MGMFDWVEFDGERYQTKDTPNQMLDNYRISGCGELWVEEYDSEFVKDQERIFGVYINQSNHRWRECREFSGTMRFYREDKKRGGYKNNAWVEYEAEFNHGIMISLKSIEDNQFIDWYKQGLEDRGLE